MADDASTSSIIHPHVPTPLSLPHKPIGYILTGPQDFELWSASVKLFLKGLGMMSHLRDDAPNPTDPRFPQWEMHDSQLCSAIISSMDRTVQQQFLRDDYTCRETWLRVSQMYAGRDFHLSQTFHQFVHLQQGSSSLDDYYSSCLMIMDRLSDALLSDPTLSRDRLRKLGGIVFLSHLSPIHQSAARTCYGTSELPTLEEAYTRLQHAMVPDSYSQPPATESSALAARLTDSVRIRDRPSARRGRGVRRGRTGSSTSPFCRYCKGTDHFIETCPRRPPPITSGTSGHSYIHPTSQYYRPHTSQPPRRGPPPSFRTSSPAPPLPSTSSDTPSGPPLDQWLADSGAGAHMTGQRTWFSTLTLRTDLSPVLLADGRRCLVQGIGRVVLSPSITLDHVLYIPSFPFSLLSVSCLTTNFPLAVVFTASDVCIQDLKSGAIIMRGHESGGVYIVPSSSPVLAVPAVPFSLIHQRLGHPGIATQHRLYPDVPPPRDFHCEACQLGKHVRTSYPALPSPVSSSLFDLVHCDVWGPAPQTSFQGYRYYILFIDDFSRATWVYLLRDRTSVYSICEQFFTSIRTQFHATPRIFRTDNAKEFTSAQSLQLYHSRGIQHQTSCAYTPQQNGVAERKNRHLLDMTRSLLLHMDVPREFWTDALLTACHIINRLPSSVTNRIPFFDLFPSGDPFPLPPRVFGCLCYAHISSPRRDKLSPRSLPCLYLGVSRSQKGYVCFHPPTRRTITTADVTFFETTRYSAPPSTSPSDPTPLSSPTFSLFPPSTAPAPPPPTTTLPPPPPLQTYARRPRPPLVDAPTPTVSVPSPASSTPSDDLPIALRKSTRQCTVRHSLAQVVSTSHLPSHLQALTAGIDRAVTPPSWKDALADPLWRAAMEDEMSALRATHTWDLCELPATHSSVSCKWVFTLKFAADGTISRRKARLVARGFDQQPGVDYDETFSPVVKRTTIRLFLSLAVTHSWSISQLDIKNAFLHGVLEEEVYMDQPPGFRSVFHPTAVCRLHRSLYGLKQSPRAWFHRFAEVARLFGLQQSSLDHSLFYSRRVTGDVYLLIYVDDIIITGSDSTTISALKTHLHQHFSTTDLGALHYFLGIEVARCPQGLFISQRRYTLDLLEETGLTAAKPASTPMDPGFRRDPTQGELLDDPTRYRRLIGRLIYLTLTRPDISFAVSVLSQYMSAPRTPHWHALLRVTRYLKAAPGRGLIYRPSRDPLSLVAYADADWAGAPDDRRSTSGYCVFLGGNLISWISKKQSVVARSSAEAEYRALALVTTELHWLRNLLHEIGLIPSTPALLYGDNQASLHIATNPVFHERTKHIEVDCHFVRDSVRSGVISLSQVASHLQLADLLTKALPGPRIQMLSSKLGVYDIYAPA